MPIRLCCTFPALCFERTLILARVLQLQDVARLKSLLGPAVASSKTKTTVGYVGQTQNTAHLCLSLCSLTEPEGSSLVCLGVGHTVDLF